jgi:hypothetical protein
MTADSAESTQSTFRPPYASLREDVTFRNSLPTYIKSLSPDNRLEVHQMGIPPSTVHPVLNKAKVVPFGGDAGTIESHTVIWGGNRVKGDLQDVGEGFRRRKH